MKNFFKREKSASFPKEFEDSIAALKITRQSTEEVVKALEKLLRDPHKNEQKVEEIAAISKTCEKYTNTFGDGSLTTILSATTTVFNIVAKKEKHMRKDCFDLVLTPLKVWVQDDYPRFMQEIEKVRKLHDAMDSAAKAVQSKSTEERVQKYEGAKAEFNRGYEGCKAELDRMKKVNQHHMSCMKLMSQHHQTFYKTIDEELDKATDAMTRTVMESNKNVK